MIYILHRLFKNRDGTAALETAIVLPLFVVLAFGIADVGGGVFTRMAISAASQAGAAYAVTNWPNGTVSDIETAMDQAVGNSSFCTVRGACTVSLPACPAPPAQCVITITASHSWTPILPTATYSWALPTGISYTTTIRVQ